MVYSASPMACGTSKHHDGPSGATNGAIATQASSSTAVASLTSPQHRDGSETSRSRKHAQKRGNGGGGARGRDVEKKAKRNIDGNDDVKAKEACGDQPPAAGYIHVRARRGQATDSHSLAERVRREKISERIKILQSLVPGCDKVTGKALMLDEIINYVQSLQNQVEFLSMKLASMDPMLYEFGVDIDSNYRYFPELLRMASMPHEQLVQCLGQANQTVAHLQHTPFDGTMTMTMTMLNSAQVELATNTADADANAEIADAPLLPLLQVQGPAAFAQDSSSSGSRVVNMMPPLSQADFDGMCSSFQ